MNDKLKDKNSSTQKELAISETALSYEKKDNARLTGRLQKEQTVKHDLKKQLDDAKNNYEQLKQEHDKLKIRSWWRRLFNVP